MEAVTDDLLADLPRHIQDGVRVVGVYTGEDYTIEYLRPDVEVTVTDDHADRIHEELLLQDLSTPYLEDLYDVGELQWTMHQFEEAMVFRFVRGEQGGLFVSVNADTDVPLRTFTETCARWV